MGQRKILLLVLVLLLLPVGLAAAQSSANFDLHRFAVVGGGSASSASFSVTSVIGQPATGVVNSSSYQVSGGFLFPLGRYPGFRVWLPMVSK